MPSRLLFALLLVSCSVYAAEFPIEIIESTDNARVVAFINESDIDDSSRWIPFEAEPPLSTSAALQAIRVHCAEDPELADATLATIELRQIPKHRQHWHYLVTLKSQLEDRIATHYFIVLMDGKVIRALREPQAVK